VKFFIDNNLPVALAQGLNEISAPYQHSVLHLTSKFKPSTPDHVWINALALEGDWIIISQDRLSKNHLEKIAFRESNLTAFFLIKGWSHIPYWEKAWKLTRWWPAIIEQAQRVQAGASFQVPMQFSGKGKFKQHNY